MTDGVILLDSDGKIVEWNPGLERITGVGRADAIGRYGWDVQWDLMPADQRRPEAREAIRASISRMLRDPGVPVDALPQQWEIDGPEGSRRTLQGRPFPFDTARGRMAGTIVRDVTENRRTEALAALDESRLEALLKLNQMTDASLKQITDFALEEGVQLTGSELGYLAFMNDDESVLTMYSWSRAAVGECTVRDRTLVYPVASTGLWGEAVRQRRPVITNDYAASPLRKGVPGGHVPIRRHMNVPVIDDGRIVAVAGVGNKAADYDESDVRQLTLLMQGMWRLVQRRRAEQAVRDSGVRFRRVFEGSGEGIVLSDLRGHIVESNAAFQAMLGYTAAELRGMVPREFTCSEDVEAERSHFRSLLAGERDSARFEKRYRRKDGRVFWGETTISPIRDGRGEAAYYLAIVRDVDERRLADEALQDSEEKFRALTETASSGILIIQDGRLRYVNPGIEHITGYTPEEFMLMDIRKAFEIVDPEFRRVLGDLLANEAGLREGRRLEMLLHRKDGAARWVDLTAKSYSFDGRPALLVTVFDVTERKLAEERVVASLHEKEVLLKEIHHRVKNNLQIISSLLSLQSMSIADRDVIGVFRESRDRIRSMALIHEKLYQSSTLAGVDFGDYAGHLATYLMHTYGLGQDVVQEVDAGGLTLGLDLAIPCGLIINELVTNSLKYAFPGGRAGKVRIALRREGGCFVLSVSDDGTGLPPGLDYRHTGSLGLQLVDTLVEQLEGSLSLDTAGGTAFTIRFPAAEMPAR